GPLTPGTARECSSHRKAFAGKATGDRRLNTPRPVATSALVRPVRRKTPQRDIKEGRLKPGFAANVDIPLAGARRLRPCPWKAKYSAGAGPRTDRKSVVQGARVVAGGRG